MTDLRAEICEELIKAGRLLGAKADLLGLVGSYGDRTLTDEDVLAALRKRNRAMGVPHTHAESPTIEGNIRREIYEAYDALGASIGLLAEIGSWGDTLPDEEVLGDLRLLISRWND